ncbi:FAD binding domain-containing protein [Diaporthe sp. PMI_573]|nr:FAD binding domain-containing protein [Diaporthaceae sp. PMI_573]
MTSEIRTEFLIVGAGPAGAGLGSFLGQNGGKGLIITNASGTADTPRAHIVNPLTLECLRDIHVEDDAMRLAVAPEMVGAFRYSQSLLGREFGKVQTWEGVPENLMWMKKYTPSRWVDLPQTYLDPILVKYASHHGFPTRFSTELVSAEREDGDWICTVNDLIRNDTYRIRTKYLFGADGGRSSVARITNAPMTESPSKGGACNILFKADLNNLMDEKHAQLYTIVNLDAHPRFGVSCIVRVIRPFREWMIIANNPGETNNPFKDVRPDDPDLAVWVRQMLGLDEHPLAKDIPVEIQRLDPWFLRETFADNYSPDKNVFILGDAAHRHPPAYGLGSNTCIQDAYNLGWKAAYVGRGLAGPGLLETYNVERQPVGAQLVKEAVEELLQHFEVRTVLGGLGGTFEDRRRIHALLTDQTAAGADHRRLVHEALEAKMGEGLSLGLCMNQWYDSSAIYLDDELEPRPIPEGFDRISEPYVSTYPGTRLPHAWLDKPVRRHMISTLDLAGKGAFCLLTGYGGEGWQDAARKISQETGIPINTYTIGLGLEWQDIYREWYSRRGVEESGCVLVRPDRVVAWRNPKIVQDCEGKLARVLNKVLSRE